MTVDVGCSIGWRGEGVVTTAAADTTGIDRPPPTGRVAVSRWDCSQCLPACGAPRSLHGGKGTGEVKILDVRLHKVLCVVVLQPRANNNDVCKLTLN